MGHAGHLTLAALLALGCATGNADWRRESYDTTVEWVGAGDGRCSDPAPFTSIRACLLHDAAYEIARRHPESAELSSEQARLVADLHLAAQMAADGWPEIWVWIYYHAVRLGGWWSFHFSSFEES